MPLRSLSDTGEIRAFELAPEAWASLKTTYRSQNLRMPCCGMPSVPKSSPLGTQFFSHARRGNCSSAPESKEHLLAKTVIARAIMAEGWDVRTEVPGQTPGGEAWIADVMATRGKANLAFEVQWSPQSDAETHRRQKQYAESGIRGLWLFKSNNFESNRDVPAFHLVLENQISFVVGMPEPVDEDAIPADLPEGEDEQQIFGLEPFIRGALQGKLKWAPAVGGTFPVKVQCADVPCWKCGKTTTLVLSLDVDIANKFPGHPNLGLDIYDFDGWENALRKLIPEAERINSGIGPIRRRSSRTAGEAYISNGCRHCDTIQGQHYDHDHLSSATTRFSSEISLVPEFLNATRVKADNVVKRWFMMP